MGTYAEGDARRVIPLVSDDAGATWYPKDGNPASAKPLTDYPRVIRLESADAGVTWTPKES